MSVTHGMNIEEVRALGQDLQTRASTIDNLIGTVERVVVSAAWVGPDARRFKDQWWPEHRARLQKLSGDLQGFGQSALNNAGEQERTSGGGGGSARVGVVPGRVGSPGMPAPDGARVTPGGGVNVPARGDLEDRFVADWKSGSGNVDPYGFYNDSSGNCTSYAAWRLNDLAAENGLDWKMSNWSVDGESTRLSNANNWDDAARDLGIPVNDQPAAGAVAQWNEPYADGYGHVAIVRSVNPNTGAITIEQSSWGGKAFEVKTLNPGDAGYPDNFIHMIPGS